MSRFCLAICVLMLAGCGMLTPTEHTDKSSAILHETAGARTTADVTRATESTPSVFDLKIGDGNSGPITLPTPQSGGATRTTARTTNNESAGVDQTETNTSSVTIPFYVKVIGLAIGGFLIVGLGALVYTLWGKLKATNPVVAGVSATAAQLGTSLDAMGHQIIQHLTDAVMSAPTPETKQQASTALAGASAIVASVQASAPTPPPMPVAKSV